MKLPLLLFAGILSSATALATPESEPDPFNSAPLPPANNSGGQPTDEPDPFGTPSPPSAGPGDSDAPMIMNNQALGAIIEEIDSKAKGQPGFWTFNLQGTDLICVTDERADRMRVMAPIARIEDVSSEQLAECMKSNFDRALDARYCVDGGVLYGAFIHPLQDLTPRLFLSAVEQVYTVKATFGTTYTSGALIFQGGEGDKKEKKEAETEKKKGTRA